MLEEFLTFEVRNAIISHMDDELPNEACGVITKKGKVYAYERSDNVHPKKGLTDPETNEAYDLFKFDAKTSARIVDEFSDVIAYVHTHPNGPAWPSFLDQEIQQSIGKPSVIASRDPTNGVFDLFSFGDHMLDLPLIHRMFRHAVTDCFEAVRSWFWQKEQVYLPPIAREDRWWRQGALDNGFIEPEEFAKNADLYEKNFKEWVQLSPPFFSQVHNW